MEPLELLGLPYFALEEVLMRLEPLEELGKVAMVCRELRGLAYDGYLMSRYWREREHVWDVLRYKRPDESWAAFCGRTVQSRRQVRAKVDALTERLQEFITPEVADPTGRRHQLAALILSQRGLISLTNLRDFRAALQDFERASLLHGEGGMPSALNNMAVAYLYLGNLHSDVRYFQMAEEKLLQGNQVTKSSVSGGNLCVALIKQGRFEEALVIANVATENARKERMQNANAFHHK